MAEQYLAAGKRPSEVFEMLKNCYSEGLDTSRMREIYEIWAPQYEQDHATVHYSSPMILADHVAKFYGNQKQIQILDVAAGTGWVGQKLHAKGFTDIDGIDASGKMLAEAYKKGCYRNLYEEFIGRNSLSISKDTYDVVVSSGSFIPGHLNEDCFSEMIHVTKPGGHIFILMNQRYFTDTPEYSKKLEPRMKELEQQGLWKLVMKKKDVPKYNVKDPGVLYVLTKC